MSNEPLRLYSATFKNKRPPRSSDCFPATQRQIPVSGHRKLFERFWWWRQASAGHCSSPPWTMLAALILFPLQKVNRHSECSSEEQWWQTEVLTTQTAVCFIKGREGISSCYHNLLESNRTVNTVSTQPVVATYTATSLNLNSQTLRLDAR